MLKDNFGRIHDYLRISLIDKCNFRCLYCLPHSSKNRDAFQGLHEDAMMTADEIERIAKTFVILGVKKIRLTGGEPLIRSDAKEILRRLSKLPVELTLTTNGSFSPDHIETFLQAGIRSVNVSLDSLSPQTFKTLTGRDEFQKVVDNIQLLVRNNFHVKINMVVMKGYNDDEVTAFVAWTKATPVHIRFIELMPFPGNHWQPEKLITWKEIQSAIELKFDGIEKLNDAVHDTAKKYKVRGHAGTFAVISTMSEPFCSGCNRMRLTADGKMRSCLFSKTETDLLTPFRKGHDLTELIESCLAGKHHMLGGHDEKNWATLHSESKERSMLAIGG